jgi:predicted amidophosphoribosyltransferase
MITHPTPRKATARVDLPNLHLCSVCGQTFASQFDRATACPECTHAMARKHSFVVYLEQPAIDRPVVKVDQRSQPRLDRARSYGRWIVLFAAAVACLTTACLLLA